MAYLDRERINQYAKHGNKAMEHQVEKSSYLSPHPALIGVAARYSKAAFHYENSLAFPIIVARTTINLETTWCVQQRRQACSPMLRRTVKQLIV
jgi:hypothetical protein